MWNLVLEGGYPVWFLLVFGLSALAAATSFAFRPKVLTFRLSVGLSVTTLFSAATGVVADLAMVGHHAPDYLKAHSPMTLSEVVLLGVGEAMSPAILGFSMLTITALLVSCGWVRSELTRE
jgi:hypothetical protein